jgi:phosphoribosylanthranilate isomerase
MPSIGRRGDPLSTFGVTLTGADEWALPRDLENLADLGAEIGILFSLSGQGNRYPDLYRIKRLIAVLGPSCAIHVCGSKARAHVFGAGYKDLHGCGRIQINGAVTSEEVFCAARAASGVVTQDNRANRELRQAAWPWHHILVDGSGGRGIVPTTWVRPETDKRVGFAGGLSPENLAVQLPLIAAVAKEPWWIDMETGLRDKNDRFDAKRAFQVMSIASDFGDVS